MAKKLLFLSKMGVALFVTYVSTSIFTSCACTDNRKPEVKNKENKDQEVAEIALASLSDGVKMPQAVAHVKPYEDSKVEGKVTFSEVSGGVKIIADIDGLSPGEHGFHVHEFGDCSGHDGMAAGAHFNPTNAQHGGPDSPVRHVGDLGNLVADSSGHAHYERIDKIISLKGEHSILGRSIIIHQDPDDYVTQPTGASGGRIACGFIEKAK